MECEVLNFGEFTMGFENWTFKQTKGHGIEPTNELVKLVVCLERP